MKNIEKLSRKLTVYTILSTALLLLVFAACGPGPTITLNKGHEQEVSFIAGSEGGNFTALDGMMNLIIPKDALNAEVKFTIKIGPEDYDNDFIIKSFIIYPKSLTLNIPAKLSLKYNEKLSNGKDPSSAKSLAIYHFRNEATFDKRNLSDMIWINKCLVNQMDYSIETEIHSGGIFAIGEESLDQTVH